MFRPMKPETAARFAAERAVSQAASRASLIARLRAKHDAEPDREYAEAVWGEMLARYASLSTVEG